MSDLRTSLVRQAMRDAMDGHEELGRPGLLRKLIALLDAQRSVFVVHRGRITEERTVPNHSAQLRALDIAFTLRDEYPHQTPSVNVGLSVAMERLPDLSHLPPQELLRLVSGSDDEGGSDGGDDSDGSDGQLS